MGFIGSVCTILVVIAVIVIVFPVLPGLYDKAEKFFSCEDDTDEKDSDAQHRS
jgi:hypothetical protein